jgi:hypothetical protein
MEAGFEGGLPMASPRAHDADAHALGEKALLQPRILPSVGEIQPGAKRPVSRIRSSRRGAPANYQVRQGMNGGVETIRVRRRARRVDLLKGEALDKSLSLLVILLGGWSTVTKMTWATLF